MNAAAEPETVAQQGYIQTSSDDLNYGGQLAGRNVGEDSSAQYYQRSTESTDIASLSNNEMVLLKNFDTKKLSNNLINKNDNSIQFSQSSAVAKENKNMLNINTKQKNSFLLQSQNLNFTDSSEFQFDSNVDNSSHSSDVIPNATSVFNNNGLSTSTSSSGEGKHLLDCSKLGASSRYASHVSKCGSTEIYLRQDEDEETLEIIKHQDSEILTSQFVNSNRV